MVNFYHKYIPRLADIAAPLIALRKKGANFTWGKPQQEAFDFLKQAIAQPPVLRMAFLTERLLFKLMPVVLHSVQCYRRSLME
jgi:hypothetical protein